MFRTLRYNPSFVFAEAEKFHRGGLFIISRLGSTRISNEFDPSVADQCDNGHTTQTDCTLEHNFGSSR